MQTKTKKRFLLKKKGEGSNRTFSPSKNKVKTQMQNNLLTSRIFLNLKKVVVRSEPPTPVKI